jgi:hypothetical protein
MTMEKVGIARHLPRPVPDQSILSALKGADRTRQQPAHLLLRSLPRYMFG